MDHNAVFVVGTGTIGEPLTGTLASLSKDLGIDEVIFYKHSPKLEDRPLVNGLTRKGANLAISEEKSDQFRKLDLDPMYSWEEALEMAKVVIDCTPSGTGLANKMKYYNKYDKCAGFIAQGSEAGFGLRFATGINDVMLQDNRFVQVVSCNTHNISILIKTLAFTGSNENHLMAGRFVCMRRANDVSQLGGFVASPEAGIHKDKKFGTHHARDVYHLFKTMGHELNVFSSAMKLNSQYMHCIQFDIHMDMEMDLEEATKRLKSDRYICVTHKRTAHQIFSMGREHGHYGRIFDETVVVLPSLLVRESDMSNGSEIVGFSFTPQDGNSLLSSITACVHMLSGGDEGEKEKRLRVLDQYQFQEI
ncbi:MAG: hypothetical protein ACXADA_19865 [Candidatus Hodarchaeales archaeon]|jgi:glyceraldehyde-3-phosphate dehydrogenase (NAD(P))